MNSRAIDGVSASGGSRKGRKHLKNDDRFLVKSLDSRNLLLAVSDGMGGHPAGDVAAEDIMDCLKAIDSDAIDKCVLLTSAIHRAEAVIRNRVSKAPSLEGMGATVTTAIVSQGWAWWGHIGDSRLYFFKDGVLHPITRDHSFLQDLVDSGDLTPEEAVGHPMSHVLDQCVGCMDDGSDSGIFNVSPGDSILLCTDGLYRTVSESEICAILASSESLVVRVELLLESAWRNGSPDDTTAVLAVFTG